MASPSAKYSQRARMVTSAVGTRLPVIGSRVLWSARNKNRKWERGVRIADIGDATAGGRRRGKTRWLGSFGPANSAGPQDDRMLAGCGRNERRLGLNRQRGGEPPHSKMGATQSR